MKISITVIRYLYGSHDCYKELSKSLCEYFFTKTYQRLITAKYFQINYF